MITPALAWEYIGSGNTSRSWQKNEQALKLSRSKVRKHWIICCINVRSQELFMLEISKTKDELRKSNK